MEQKLARLAAIVAVIAHVDIDEMMEAVNGGHVSDDIKKFFPEGRVNDMLDNIDSGTLD